MFEAWRVAGGSRPVRASEVPVDLQGTFEVLVVYENEVYTAVSFQCLDVNHQPCVLWTNVRYRGRYWAYLVR
jgi:hypothetical protein